MNEDFAFLNPFAAELAKAQTKNATPAKPPTPWYKKDSNFITFAEGGINGKYVSSDGMINSYLDKAATNENNISFVDDGMGNKGAYTVGRGFTYNPLTGDAITPATKISKQDEKLWMSTVRESFDKEASRLWPKYWAAAPDYEKDALMVYFHQFTGFPETYTDKDGNKKAKIKWAIKQVAPKLTKILSNERTPEVINSAAFEIYDNTRDNKTRNKSTQTLFKTGKLWDYSIKGSKEVSKNPRPLEYKVEE